MQIEVKMIPENDDDVRILANTMPTILLKHPEFKFTPWDMMELLCKLLGPDQAIRPPELRARATFPLPEAVRKRWE